MTSFFRTTIIGLMAAAVVLLVAMVFSLRSEGHTQNGNHDIVIRTLEPSVVIVGNMRRTQAMERDFQRFSRAGYYGAFAASRDGVWQYVAGVHTVEVARTAAMDMCNKRRRHGQIPCRIVAEIRPKDDLEAPGVTLSQNGTQAFLEWLDQPGPAAFAIAENGAVAAVSSQSSLQLAQARALSTCQARAGMQASLDDPSSQECRLISSRDGEI